MLSNLLTEDQLLDESFSFSPLGGFPSNGDSPASLLSENKSEVASQNDPLSIVLNVPSAFGIKTTQDKVTYINKGESGERERVCAYWVVMELEVSTKFKVHVPVSTVCRSLI